MATSIDDNAADEKSDKSIWRLLNIHCTIERRANLYLAIRRHLCYYVYNNRNEVKRGKSSAVKYGDKD